MPTKHSKKVCNLAESLDNTHELRQKIEQFTAVPENDIESYVANSNNEDESDEEVRFVIIFTTKRILSYLKLNNNVHIDCTYCLNWNRFPVCVVGTKNVSGLKNLPERFFGYRQYALKSPDLPI